MLQNVLPESCPSPTITITITISITIWSLEVLRGLKRSYTPHALLRLITITITITISRVDKGRTRVGQG